MKKDFVKEQQRAEKEIQALHASGSLKKVDYQSARELMSFYENKCLTRLETARILFIIGSDSKLKMQATSQVDYADYSEIVSASYYAMYYIVHAYLAATYFTKLEENVRGVHAITHKIVVYYLVKTKKLAQHLYEEYLKTLDEVSRIQDISIEEFRKDAFEIAESYDHVRDSREIFTYFVSKNAEEHHAENTIKVAEEFINTIKQLMLK